MVDLNHVAGKDDIYSLKEEIADLRKYIDDRIIGMMRWSIAMHLGQAGLITALIKLP